MFSTESTPPVNFSQITGFEILKYEDQLMLLREMNIDLDENCELEKRIKLQTDEHWGYVDKLQSLKLKDLEAFLFHNNYTALARGFDCKVLNLLL